MAVTVAVATCAGGTATATKASGPKTAQIVVGPVLDIEFAETSFYLRVGGPAEAVPPRNRPLLVSCLETRWSKQTAAKAPGSG